jgi:hypothetical protein
MPPQYHMLCIKLSRYRKVQYSKTFRLAVGKGKKEVGMRRGEGSEQLLVKKNNRKRNKTLKFCKT